MKTTCQLKIDGVGISFHHCVEPQKDTKSTKFMIVDLCHLINYPRFL